jgi:hypothetical protein
MFFFSVGFFKYINVKDIIYSKFNRSECKNKNVHELRNIDDIILDFLEISYVIFSSGIEKVIGNTFSLSKPSIVKCL